MKLPIPIISSSENIYTNVEIERPESGHIINADNIIKRTGNSYEALLSWISSCTISISSESNEITNRTQIRSMLKKAAYKNAELIGIEAILLINDDDEIEGVYNCPRCDTQIIAERKIEDGEEIYNTADYVSQLKRIYVDEEKNPEIYNSGLFPHEFKFPVNLGEGRSPGNDLPPITEVESIVFHYPTLNDCIGAYNEIGGRDKSRLQFKIYAKAIEKINGMDVNTKWKSTFGVPLFNKIKGIKEDLIEIMDKGNEFGLANYVNKRCPNCEKEWKESINNMNFFGSALRSIS
jgi:ssDNA-binding Zn-finger/Zn-ribbon topoisomerase 1